MFFRKTTLPLRGFSDLSVTTPRTVRSCASCFLSCAVVAVDSKIIAPTKQLIRRRLVIWHLPQSAASGKPKFLRSRRPSPRPSAFDPQILSHAPDSHSSSPAELALQILPASSCTFPTLISCLPPCEAATPPPEKIAPFR